jgi:Family of unknown function (DUF5990)
VQLRIEGHDLPGRGVGNVHVGVQRRGRPDDLLDRQPGDADTVQWTFPVELVDGPAGREMRGPYVQGGPGQRFVYLSWGTVDDSGFAMFRRAKLWLTEVPADVLAEAEGKGSLVGRLGLTDPRGEPLCASVRPPAIIWTAG